ncbi:aminotransferase class III-fold pyridoxal phosphate-dependent enzyme [Ruegeria sp.]|uniref:aminotransferase class III-fold pyridoxal phosphate-dependent enzyme n=1 Tax=Ruegeria sp. TaxID=1879320 RepID=UPI00231D741D|nr:aminotransferase class III-fold pyridoxal phosphate-dependent enzyme [Ruegeria sp.]MDA7966504.1 aminotransferase class III-fold pyridoxal phosphate-dependent enzyme [Ruegeria sp.]
MKTASPETGIKFMDRNPPAFSMPEVEAIARDIFGLSGQFKTLDSERDLNFRVTTDTGEAFVLKIANSDEDPGVVDYQTQALLHIQAQDPDLLVPRVVPTLDGEPMTTVGGQAGETHIVRMLSYLPGRVLLETGDISVAARRDLGRMMARLDLALRGFFHPCARNANPWAMMGFCDLKPHLSAVEDVEIRALISAVFDRMESYVLPRLKGMRHQVVHQDAHRGNVLLDPENPDRIAGLIDMGDMTFAPLVVEPAIAADPLHVKTDDPWGYITDIVSGFDAELPLEGDEIDLIYDLVLARFAATAMIIAWRKAETPDNAWLPGDEAPCWALLRYLVAIGRDKACRRLRRACGFSEYCPPEPDALTHDPLTETDEALIARRHDVLGSNLYTFYRRPLHVVRGSGPWLYSAQGHRYLDVYNNVPVVGHSHPHVVRATTRQIEALNTNTRYLYDVIVDFSERLLATMPAHLDTCLFVNSGSEANDVAWQMAQFATGKTGALIMQEAYHGITECLAHLSPQFIDGEKPAHVQYLDIPDPYRGKYTYADGDYTTLYASDADRAIGDLSDSGHPLAAFMVDSSMLSSGVPDVPAGYLLAVEKKVKAAGGLLIADEVQAGFARSGTHMWGFQANNLSPDLVTLGKPVGNGFPLGVVITNADLMHAFRAHTGLFSTFGGNPVGCAAGMAVLDVIENENLLQNAKDTGQYMRDQFRSLMSRHHWIGDVRGTGMIAGVELIRNAETQEPATAETKDIVEMMRDRQVLIAKEGMYGNVLKIRPSLVFRRQHVDVLISALDDVLTSLPG